MDTPIRAETTPSSSPVQYEFTSRQNAVIGPLAHDMLWVALPLQLVGVLYGVALIAAVIKAFREPHVFMEAALIGLAMLFYLALGVWTSRAARSFKDVVATQGNDVGHLMDGLDNLRKLYGLLSIIVKFYVLVVVVAVVVGLVAALAGWFKG
jgi:hypothetical protein